MFRVFFVFLQVSMFLFQACPCFPALNVSRSDRHGKLEFRKATGKIQVLPSGKRNRTLFVVVQIVRKLAVAGISSVVEKKLSETLTKGIGVLFVFFRSGPPVMARCVTPAASTVTT